MANRYWVGGGSSADWAATGNTNWGSASNTQDNASVPTAADDVFFDGVGTGAADCTVSAAAVCRSLDFTGYINTFTHNAAVAISIGDATAGAGNVALKMVAGMTYTKGSTSTSVINFISTSTTQQTVTTGGKTLAGANFNGAGGSWLWTDSFSMASTSSNLNLISGTLNTNGQTFVQGDFQISGTTTRVLTLGASAINCRVWDATVVTGLTFNPNTSTITSTLTFTGGGLTYNNVVLSHAIGNTRQLTDANTFANLTETGNSGKENELILSANQTITGTLTFTGNSQTSRLLIKSNILGTTRTLNAAAVALTNVDFQDITGAGAASWSGTSVGNALGNSGITFTTPVTRYWVGNGGNWSDTNRWSTSTGGSGGASVPICHDTVIFDANSITSASQTISMDMPRAAADITCTGTLNSPAISFAALSVSVFGSLTWASGMTINAGGFRMSMYGRSSHTLTCAGVTFNHGIDMLMIGGTLTLQDAYFATFDGVSTFLTNGTFNSNGFNFTGGKFSSNNSNVRTLTMGSSVFNLTGVSTVWDLGNVSNLTFNPNTSTIKATNSSSSSKSFSGGGLVYNNFWFAPDTGTGTLNIIGSNTFNDFKDDGSIAHSILFTDGTTTTVTTWTVSGLSGNLITLNSTGGANDFNLVKAGGGVISSNYLNIQNSDATPASTWYAGANSVDNNTASGGTGWIFTAPPPTAVTIQKSLKYTILKTISAITKSLTYRATRKIYSREFKSTLPNDTTLLVTAYSESEIADVDTDNDVFVDIGGYTPDYYLIHLYKYNHDNAVDSITVTVKQKSTVDASVSEIFLQIWNYDTTAWETLDSDTTTGADTEFELTGTISVTPENYYGPTYNQIVARVYQQK